MVKKTFKDIWPVMLTPFLSNGKVDISGLEKLIDFYLQSGVTGLFANCLSSEMYELNPRERIKITEIIVKKTNNKVPVISSGTFGSDIKNNTDFIKEIYDTGVQAVVVNTNQLVSPDESDDILQSRIDHLMNHIGKIPLSIYECPVPYKRLLSPDLLKWISKTNRFLYLKDTSCNIKLIEAKLKAIEGHTLHLFNAHTPTGLESLQLGASGLTPIGANYFPELFVYLVKWFNIPEKEGQLKEINDFLCRVDSELHNHYPLSSKIFLQKRGLGINTTTRTKIEKLSKKHKKRLNEILKKFENLTEKLFIKTTL